MAGDSHFTVIGKRDEKYEREGRALLRRERKVTLLPARFGSAREHASSMANLDRGRALSTEGSRLINESFQIAQLAPIDRRRRLSRSIIEKCKRKAGRKDKKEGKKKSRKDRILVSRGIIAGDRHTGRLDKPTLPVS